MTVQEIYTRINALKAEIEGHGKLRDDVLRKIQYKFRLDWNYHSNSMEGNSLTMQETRSIMLGNITVGGKPLNDVLEMQGHDEVVDEIMRLGHNEGRISESRIKAIHKGIMHEDAPEMKAQIGVWKTEANFLINARHEKMQFTLPELVAEEIHDLLNWLNAGWDKIDGNAENAPHPVALAAEFHTRYLKIHPFYDGNGRTGRILLNLILIAHGYPVVVIKQEEKDNYYKYLSEVQMYDAPLDLFWGFVGNLVLRSQEVVLKAIAGEEIEEVDDVLKEIRMLKKKVLAEEANVLSRSPEVLKKTYFESIEPLGQLFIRKFAEFDDLFANQEHTFSVRAEARGYSGKYLDEYWSESTEGFPDGVYKGRLMDNFEVSSRFYGFKGKKQDPFSTGSYLNVQFEEYQYVVEPSDKTNRIQKLYSEPLTLVEMEEIVNGKLKDALENLKKRINQDA